MLIETYYEGVEIHREEKIIYAKFIQPHQVLSTCRASRWPAGWPGLYIQPSELRAGRAQSQHGRQTVA